jgi:CubicO group peptidase (beta-lactamase class C family)
MRSTSLARRLRFGLRAALISAGTLQMFGPSGLLAQWNAQHGLTAAQFQSSFDSLFHQGYRLKSVSGYVSGGGERFAGLWVKESGPAWQARVGMSAADYQKTFDDLSKQGYRLTWVTAHDAAGSPHFEAIWEQRAGPAWQAHHDLTAASYASTVAAAAQQGFRVIHATGYNSGGAVRYAVILEQSPGPLSVSIDMSPAQLQSSIGSFAAGGYRLREVTGYNVGGADHYAAIWDKTVGPLQLARTGVPDSWYQNVHDNLYFQGYSPAFVSAFTSGGGARVNTIWTNSSFSAGDLQTIASKIRSYMASYQAPAVALAIAKDGRLVYAAGFGYANKETGEEAGPTSLFRIASVSKQFTSAAIMNLVETSRLSLDDRVFGPGGRLAADFPTPASNPMINRITIRHLLRHVSGLNNGAGGDSDVMFMNVGMTQHQLISWALSDPYHVVTRDTSTRWEYLNFGYSLLGRVIEKVTGEPYDQYVRESVLRPSGISDMMIAANSEAQRKPREVKYYPASAYTLNVTRFDAHGGWLATPIDLARFLVHVDGSSTVPDILTAQSHTLMLTAAHVRDAAGKDPNYGFGWEVNPQWHNGAMDGTIAEEVVLPNGFAYAFIVNTRPGADLFAGKLDAVIQSILSTVTAWPSYNLF